MEKHISIVASFQIGLAILGILAGVFIFIILHFAAGLSGDEEAQMIVSIVARVLAGFFFILSIPCIIAGLGLFARKEWARILTLIMSVISLLNFPVGTAVGIYSIWALVNPQVVQHFKKNTGVTPV